MEKIWGIYNTYPNPEYYVDDEFYLWEKISSFDPFFQSEDRDSILYNIEFLIYSTRKYGVEFDEEPSETKHVIKSESYYKWFNFWNNHFSKMDKRDYYTFLKEKVLGHDVSKYMPEGTWKGEKTL